MNAGVILAAGDSTRMGFPKQLAEVKNKPLLELVIEKVNTYFELSTVVLGSENEIIEEKINFYNSNILINENWEEGIVSSIRTALFFYQEQKQIEKFTKANINQMAKDNDNDYVYLIRIDWDLEKSIRENPNINFIKIKETNNDDN